ncbi:hypothetical protein H7H51_01555 [Mycolicibacterium farcinogenes]|nr:hypothetical protein [Mycolicibacterium farcinogenes]
MKLAQWDLDAATRARLRAPAGNRRDAGRELSDPGIDHPRLLNLRAGLRLQLALIRQRALERFDERHLVGTLVERLGDGFAIGVGRLVALLTQLQNVVDQRRDLPPPSPVSYSEATMDRASSAVI